MQELNRILKPISNLLLIISIFAAIPLFYNIYRAFMLGSPLVIYYILGLGWIWFLLRIRKSVLHFIRDCTIKKFESVIKELQYFFIIAVIMSVLDVLVTILYLLK